MAERRMFAKTIVQSSRFLKMPVSSRELYFQMGMSADDDGVVEAWNVMRLTNAREDDLRVLVSRGYVQILNNEDMIAYLNDWDTNNTIRKDRYHKGVYKDLKIQVLEMLDNQVTTTCQPNDNQCETEVRLGKVSIGKVSIGKDICSKPDEPTYEPPIISLILNDKTEYGITQKVIDDFQELYPAVDIMQELRKMKGWCINNPTKRKTKRGINRFINSWLAREQDKGRVTTTQSIDEQMKDWK